MKKIKITKYTKADTEQLIDVMHSADDRDKKWAEEKLKSFNKKHRVLITAKLEERIIGYSAVKAIEDSTKANSFLDTQQYAHLMWIAVLPDLRKQGTGSLLLEEMGKIALKMGKRGIWLDCRESKLRFYEKNGYSVLGKYEDEGKPRFVLAKDY